MLSKVLSAGLLVSSLAVPASTAAAPTPTATEHSCRGHAATIVGTAGDDRIRGTRGRDVVVGLGGDDRILGLSGDDVLCGNAGGDDLVGGPGHDRLHGGRDGYEQPRRRTRITGDLLEGGPGDDHLSAGFDRWTGRYLVLRRNTVTYRHSRRGVEVDLAARTATGEGTDVVVPGRLLAVDGSRYDDRLRGSRRAEALDGGRGDDVVSGGEGRDVVLGYRGDDQLAGEQGADLVISTSGVSTVDGGDGDDWVIAGSRRPATVLGGAGSDYLSRTIMEGESGLIDGGPGRDQLELAAQLWFDRGPVLTLDAAAGTAVAAAGEDTQTTAFTSVDAFTLWHGDWVFRGSEADDFVQVLHGRLDADALGGDDFLLGGDRADVLDGGDGTDQVWGGKGRNTCLNAEAGDCDGYPWDTTTTRARVVPQGATSPARLAPRALEARWLGPRAPFATIVRRR